MEPGRKLQKRKFSPAAVRRLNDARCFDDQSPSQKCGLLRPITQSVVERALIHDEYEACSHILQQVNQMAEARLNGLWYPGWILSSTKVVAPGWTILVTTLRIRSVPAAGSPYMAWHVWAAWFLELPSILSTLSVAPGEVTSLKKLER